MIFDSTILKPHYVLVGFSFGVPSGNYEFRDLQITRAHDHMIETDVESNSSSELSRRSTITDYRVNAPPFKKRRTKTVSSENSRDSSIHHRRAFSRKNGFHLLNVYTWKPYTHNYSLVATTSRLKELLCERFQVVENESYVLTQMIEGIIDCKAVPKSPRERTNAWLQRSDSLDHTGGS